MNRVLKLNYNKPHRAGRNSCFRIARATSPDVKRASALSATRDRVVGLPASHSFDRAAHVGLDLPNALKVVSRPRRQRSTTEPTGFQEREDAGQGETIAVFVAPRHENASALTEPGTP